MPISAVCPSCRSSFSLPDHLLGKTIRCTRCQGTFVAGAVPVGRPAAPPPERRVAKPSLPVAAPAAYAPGLPTRAQKERRGSLSFLKLVIGGSIVAAVFAAVLVGGIAFVLRQNSDKEPVAAAKSTESQDAPVNKREPDAKVNNEPPSQSPPRELPREPADAPMLTADGSLAPAVLQRVKKATVYVKVTMPNSSVSQGSGFFAVEQGVVLTNAHVLGMLVGQTRRPQRVEVVLHSGQPDERTVLGQILEVDRTSDLAVLRVSGDNLPEPLNIYAAKDLQETQQVFVCGFPLGVNLGREVSVRKSSVASLRREGADLAKVQLEGGMDPGNSGGPIVDNRGRVVGVAVAGIRTTTIAFAIPGEKVNSIVNGRVSKAIVGQPFKDGDKTKLPITLQVVDPLGRIRQAGLEVWMGEPGPARPPSGAPVAKANDSPHQRTLFTYKDGEASGEIVLPAIPGGQVYWLQPLVLNTTGQPQWVSAVAWDDMAPPLERKATTLALGHKAGNNFPVRLGSTTKIRMERSGEDHTLVIGLDGQLAENTRTVDNQGTAAIRLDYVKMSMDVTMDGKPSNSNNRMQQALQSLGQMNGDIRIDKQGNVLENKLDLTKVPAGARDGLSNVGDQVQQTLETLTIPLPGNMVNPGQSWNAQRSLPIDAAGKYDAGIIDMKYTYLGVRSRNGREEAVVSINGVVRARQGVKQYISGKTHGSAVIDIATGLVTQAMATVEVDLDLALNGQPAKADGAVEIKLQRNLSGK